MTEMPEHWSKILGLMPGLGSFIDDIFNRQFVVWEAIDKKMAEYPEKAQLIYESFMLFSEEVDAFNDVHIVLWEDHVNELLDRIGQGAKKSELNLGTRAQIVLGCMHTSLKAPFTHEGTGFYEYLFRQIFGDTRWKKLYQTGEMLDELIPNPKSRQAYEGQYEQMVDEYKRKLSEYPQDRWAALPDQKELDARRAKDIARNNKKPYFKYDNKNVQLGLL